MLLKKRRGSTLSTFALIIGLLVVSLIVVVSVKRLWFWQASQIEQDVSDSIASSISEMLTKADYSTANMKVGVESPLAERIIVNVTKHYLAISIPDRHLTSRKVFNSRNLNIMPSVFEMSNRVFMYKRDRNIIFTDNLTCNTTDERCDPGCTVLGVCDPACYQPGIKDGVCSPYCIDYNNDSVIDRRDFDGICDPDCYNNDADGGVYDPDCIKPDDGICDPDTNNKQDFLCDRDCLGTNGVCDPDCKETDKDCPPWNDSVCNTAMGESCTLFPECSCPSGRVCDENCIFTGSQIDDRGCVDKSLLKKSGDECNYSCECDFTAQTPLFCQRATPSSKGHCCPKGKLFDGSHCIDMHQDGICEPFENCMNAPHDCKCNNAKACCPSSNDANEAGCVTPKNNMEECTADCECTSKNCNNGHCCAEGYKYDDTQQGCVLDCSSCTTTDQYSCPGCDCTKNNGLCDSGKVCCPADSHADHDSGCTTKEGLAEGKECACSNQCASNNCANKHCCLPGQFWDDTSGYTGECIKAKVYIVNEGGAGASLSVNNIESQIPSSCPYHLDKTIYSINEINDGNTCKDYDNPLKAIKDYLKSSANLNVSYGFIIIAVDTSQTCLNAYNAAARAAGNTASSIVTSSGDYTYTWPSPYYVKAVVYREDIDEINAALTSLCPPTTS